MPLIKNQDICDSPQVPITIDQSGEPQVGHDPCAESQCMWSLPEPVLAADLMFTWGSHDGQSLLDVVLAAYEECIHWRPNLFLVPFSKAGKHFVFELARLYRAFAEGSTLESIALKATVV